MAAQGYIGRAPGESSVVVARQTFTPTGITTNFTFVSGYTVGYVDAYLNGARLIEGSDYTATDGSVVGLSTNAINGDVLELVAYKAFNVNNVTGANGDFSVPDKIIHANDTDTAIRFPQADTFTVETAGSEVIRIDANGNVGIGTTNTLRVADPKNQSGLNVGFVTANSITAAAGTFGSLNVSGTLTYEDVANQDVVGFSTFQKGINVQGAGSTTTTLNVTGVTTMTGDVNIAAAFNIPDAITHVGDTNTKIRFPAADTFTVETAGSEVFRADSNQRLVVGANSALSNVKIDSNTGSPLFQVEGSTYQTAAISLTRTANSSPYFYLNSGSSGNNATGSLGRIMFNGFDGTNYVAAAAISGSVDGTPGTDDMPGRLTFSTSADGSQVPTERLRIDSSGRLLLGATSSEGAGRYFQIAGTDAASAGMAICRNTNNNDGVTVDYIKSRNATYGSNTIVQDDDTVGKIQFRADDGTDYTSQVAAIQVSVDGTPGVNDTPGRITFLTTADGASTPTERLRITSGGNVRVPDNGKFTAGADDDLEIFSDNTDQYIRGEQNQLLIRSNNLKLQSYLGENYIHASNNSAVSLYHDNSKRFETTDDGADFSGTGSIKVPVGTTAQRNGSPTAGDFRYNSDEDKFEGYTTEWGEIGGSGGGGITTQVGNASGIVTSMFLTDATDHKVTATGICTITTTQSGTEGESHTIRIVNSGIATVGFSTYFLFPSGSAPSLPTANGAVSLISFTVHDSVGAGCTQLLAGASVNFS